MGDMMQQFCRFRYDLGATLRTCMVCAEELKGKDDLKYGLCSAHRKSMMRSPKEVKRWFGRGLEYQLLRHTDELDEVIYRLEYGEDIDSSYGGEPGDEWARSALAGAMMMGPSEYLIYARYVAVLFLARLRRYLDLDYFDYITFVDAGYVSMEIIFTEMGYLLGKEDAAGLFLTDRLHTQILSEQGKMALRGKKVLLLDVYRGIETRRRIDQLRLWGAGEVLTVYLTGYS